MTAAEQVALFLEPHSQTEINAQVAALVDSKVFVGLTSPQEIRTEELKKQLEQALHAALQKKAALDAQVSTDTRNTYVYVYILSSSSRLL